MNIMCLDIVESSLNHAFDQKFAIAQLADPTPLNLFPSTSIQPLLAVFFALELACFLQTIFTIWPATEVTMTILEVLDVGPLSEASVAAFLVVMVSIGRYSSLHKEDWFILVELVWLISNAERSTCIQKDINFIQGLTKGALA